MALSFNTDEDGGDVGVLIGEARILPGAPPPDRLQIYLQKYTAGIQSLGMTTEAFLAEYPVVILVTPAALRGF